MAWNLCDYFWGRLTGCFFAYHFNKLSYHSVPQDEYYVFLGKRAKQLVFNDHLQREEHIRRRYIDDQADLYGVNDPHKLVPLLSLSYHDNLRGTNNRAKRTCFHASCNKKTSYFCE